MLNIEASLGLDAIDTSTGYSGVITAYSVYDTGVKSVLIESVDTNNRPASSWVDINRIKVAVPKKQGESEKQKQEEDALPDPSLIDVLKSVIEDLENEQN